MSSQGVLAAAATGNTEYFRKLPLKMPQRLETRLLHIEVIETAAKKVMQGRIGMTRFDSPLDKLTEIPRHECRRVLAAQTLAPVRNRNLTQNVQIAFPGWSDPDLSRKKQIQLPRKSTFGTQRTLRHRL
ncbi:MAG: hypothetical protein RLZZ505_2562 [Verrucomicrobiota bacterium]